ncbi:MAG: hypothetical protein Q8O52_21865 [Sulfuritalea sp.]|nr:hypothetical protein [Sulfuritalea sp.]
MRMFIRHNTSPGACSVAQATTSVERIDFTEISFIGTTGDDNSAQNSSKDSHLHGFAMSQCRDGLDVPSSSESTGLDAGSVVLIEAVPGAKIPAIADAFEAVTLKHGHRGEGRSLLRAVAEINAGDKQFSAEWIEHFNQAIRGMVEA